MSVVVSSKILPEKILLLKRAERYITTYVLYKGIHVKWSLLLSGFHENCISSTALLKPQLSNLIKICPNIYKKNQRDAAWQYVYL